MSGPKTSVLSPNFLYYNALTEHARAQWAEKEILFCLLSMQESEQAISGLICKLQQLLEAHGPDERIISLLEEANACREVSFEDIDEDRGITDQELRDIRRDGAVDVSFRGSELLDTRGLRGKYLEYFQSIRGKTLQQKTNIARACAGKAAAMKQLQRKLALAHWDRLESIKEQVFADGIATSFYIPFTALRGRGGADEQIARINEALRPVSDMILTDDMLSQLQQLRQQAAELRDASCLSTFYQVVVRPFVESCAAYDGFYRAHNAEYEEYRTSYEILCEELGLVPQQLELSAEAITFYQAKTLELQELLLKRRTREAVMRTVDQVMAEMGYELVASRDVVKKSGKQYRDELYVYGEGTAISVVHTSDGQLTMELGGMDYGDRTPTEEEARGMAQQMVSFCVDFEAITEELKRRGLDLKTVTLLPADERYATIINLEDYEVRGKVETISEAKKEERKTTDTKKKKQEEG